MLFETWIGEIHKVYSIFLNFTPHCEFRDWDFFFILFPIIKLNIVPIKRV